jgi:hypothetical protein
MKSHVALIAGIGLGMMAAWTPLPARVVSLAASQDAQHEQHQQGAGGTTPGGKMMMGNRMASDAKLEELVRKMNDARGDAKTDAIAEVVTALVQQHRTMHGMMAGKTGGTNAAPAPPGK